MSSSDQPVTFPIKAQYKFTPEEMIQGLKTHLRYKSGKLKLRQAVGWIMVVLAVCTLFRGKAALAKAFPIILMIFVGLLLIFRDQLFALAFKLRFRNSPNKDVLVSWTFSPETISSEGQGYNFSASWTKLRSFIESPKGFLIYSQDQAFHWIPFSGFSNEAEIDSVRQIARSQPIAYKKVS